MRPAFTSTKSAAAFAVLLLLVLLSPVLVGKNLLPPRSKIYSSLTWRYGPFSYLHRQMFAETNDLDVAFIGSSRVWAGMDTPYFQDELTKALGRPARVQTFGWSWLGFDALYFTTKDLLEHRRARMIVFDDEYWFEPHVAATRWFRFADDADALRGMPLKIQASYYFASVLGTPRNLLNRVRNNFPEELVDPASDHWKNFYRAPNSAGRLGTLTVERGLSPTAPFIPFTAEVNVQPSAVRVYSPETKSDFQFTGPPTPDWQLQFAKKFAALAQAHGARLVYLHLQPPFSANETNSPVILERECWPDVLGTNVTMLGIAPEKLFAGISGEDFPKLFYTPDWCHFNRNGQEFFTRVVTPALIQVYEKTDAR
jgi:hypothetical protein